MPAPSNLSSSEREQLLIELKRRLEEIQAIKRALGMSESEPSPDEKNGAPASPLTQTPSSISPARKNFTPADVQGALEELIVPPLEMLDDRPLVKKKQSSY